MKTKLTLIALIAAFSAAFTPLASADSFGSSGYYVTKLVGYDHCGHPIYRRVWVEVCRPEPRPCYPRVSIPFCPPFFGHGSHGGHHHHH